MDDFAATEAIARAWRVAEEEEHVDEVKTILGEPRGLKEGRAKS